MERFEVTAENIECIYRRIRSFVNSKKFKYISDHNFDIDWGFKVPYGVVREVSDYIKGVELHLSGSINARSVNNFIRVPYISGEALLMVYEGDFVEFTKDRIIVKRAWRANNYTAGFESVYSRLRRNIKYEI